MSNIVNIQSHGIGIGTNVSDNTSYNVEINEAMIVEGLFPIGSLYFNINNINPAAYFGGTWELFNPGKTILGVDENYINFHASELTGGEKTHKLTVNEIPAHTHSWKSQASALASGTTRDRTRAASFDPNNLPFYSNYVGGGEAHNNMQPYRSCYIWKRIA